MEERIGDSDRLVEQTSGIVAQIDDKALELWTNLPLQIFNGPLQISGGLLIEASDVDIAHVVLGLVLNRYDVDYAAHELHVDRVVNTFADDGQSDRRFRRPSHLVNGLLEGKSANWFFIKRGNHIIALQARARRWRAVDWRDDFD